MASDMNAQYQIRRITADQYHRMGEAGIIEQDERVELLDGALSDGSIRTAIAIVLKNSSVPAHA
jgi:hypothetical protein